MAAVSWSCELGYGADTMFYRTYFLSLKMKTLKTLKSFKTVEKVNYNTLCRVLFLAVFNFVIFLFIRNR